MAKKARVRRLFSIQAELLAKSRESALAAVQIFNSPLITFKSEIFIVLMNIAWTYLLHSYYREKKIEYRYFQMKGSKRVFSKTKSGAYKRWELERCLNEQQSPLDIHTSNNLRFLIGIRHEIEHQMTTRIDTSLSAKFQACCLNYNDYVKKLFGAKFGIDKYLSFSLQFSSISRENEKALLLLEEMPFHIKEFIGDFERELSYEEFNDHRFAYRLLFVPKTVNRRGQADKVIEFVKAESQFAQDVNRAYTVIKETERPKYLPNTIVRMMKDDGYEKFTMKCHTELWQSEDAKNMAKGYGVKILKQWYWYDNWVNYVKNHCMQNASKYRMNP